MASNFFFLIYLLIKMKPLYSKIELEIAKDIDELAFECYECSNTFYKKKKLIISVLDKKNKNVAIKFCSKTCKDKGKITKTKVICKQCNIEFFKIPSEIKRRPNHFCTKSCATRYNNAHKIKGTTRSKLEIWLENQLTLIYPNIEFHFNKKDAINSELDIYVPSLKLAFELNGIFHYEPIFGSDKLIKMQNNDHRKFQACIERDISLCVIDTSKQKYFKETTSQEFLDIIIKIID